MNIEFKDTLNSSLADSTFIRLILSSPAEKKSDLNKVTIRLIELKDGPKLSFLYTYKTKTVTKNFDLEEGNVYTNMSEGALGFFAACSVIADTSVVQ